MNKNLWGKEVIREDVSSVFFYLRIHADPSVETRVRIHGSKRPKITYGFTDPIAISKNAANFKHFLPKGYDFFCRSNGSNRPKITYGFTDPEQNNFRWIRGSAKKKTLSYFALDPWIRKLFSALWIR